MKYSKFTISNYLILCNLLIAIKLIPSSLTNGRKFHDCFLLESDVKSYQDSVTSHTVKETTTEAFTIKNGTVVDPEYHHEFHTFFEKKILKLLVVLPGIISESIQLRVEDTDFEIHSRIAKNYQRLYNATIINIEGKLAEPVLKNVMTINYDRGILTIELVRKSQLKRNDD